MSAITWLPRFPGMPPKRDQSLAQPVDGHCLSVSKRRGGKYEASATIATKKAFITIDGKKTQTKTAAKREAERLYSKALRAFGELE